MEEDMSTVTVSLFLHGLIALVPLTGGDGKANQMVALVLDARNVKQFNLPPDFSCVADHKPKLVFYIPDTAQGECTDAGCKPINPASGKAGEAPAKARCECVPVKKKIWLEPSIAPERKVLPTAVPKKELPEGHYPDFSYVENLGTAGRRLAPAFMNDAPALLLDRMTFPFDSVTACKLGARDVDAMHANVHSFSLHPLRVAHDSKKHTSQAAAQEVWVKTTYGVTADHPLKIWLSNLDGSNPHGVRLPQSGIAEITLGNDRPLDTGARCDDGVARDFALYYLFTTDPPTKAADWTSDTLRLPHVKTDVKTTDTSIATPECELLHAEFIQMSHPICAMAAFRAP
jgi:hypothetical protein